MICRFHFEGQSMEFCHSQKTIKARRISEVIAALHRIDDAVSQGAYAAGYLAYEAAAAFDPAFPSGPLPPWPILEFGLYDKPTPLSSSQSFAEDLKLHWTSDTLPETFLHNVATIRQAIARGEVYQVNYAMRLAQYSDIDPQDLFRAINGPHPSPYSAFLRTDHLDILSWSPELFFSVDGQTIVTRPMKGTRARGRWLEEDLAAERSLKRSTKDRAENLMIVDLLRNDLSRIARIGTVRVERQTQVTPFSTVYQMTSDVVAELDQRPTLTRILSALFPSGSVTGAPKIAAMHMIQHLEPSPRGVYCGTIGYVAPSRKAMFNVPIRTAVVDRQTHHMTYGVGSGITWGSCAHQELAETWAKARILQSTYATQSFNLFETMRLDARGYYLLNRHLSRLASSAKFFDMPYNREVLRSALADFADHAPSYPLRVRVVLTALGTFEITGAPIAPLPQAPMTIAIAPDTIDPENPLTYHKTTLRGPLDALRDQYPDPVFDVLLRNPHGHFTEFTRGNLVVQWNGRMLTPPRTEGLLAGTLRDHLLARGIIHEYPIDETMLLNTRDLWFINSVRGWIAVTLGTKS